MKRMRSQITLRCGRAWLRRIQITLRCGRAWLRPGSKPHRFQLVRVPGAMSKPRGRFLGPVRALFLNIVMAIRLQKPRCIQKYISMMCYTIRNSLLAMVFLHICVALHSFLSSSVVSESEVCAGDGGKPESRRYGMRWPFGMLSSG